MHTIPWLPPALALGVLAGCATPEPTKTLGKQTRDSVATMIDAYEQDLGATKTYITSLKSAALTLKAEADRNQANAAAAIDAWKAAATAEVKLSLLARWDERVAKLLKTDLDNYVQAEYYPKVNAVVRLLRQDLHAKQQAATATADNVSLQLAAAEAQVRVLEYERQADRALLEQIGYLHGALASARDEIVARDLQLTVLTGKVAVVSPPALRTEPITAVAVPATDPDVVALEARRVLIERIDKAHDKAAGALNQYLETDGYARVLAQSAITGFARSVLNEVKIPELVGQASAKIGLPADVGDQLKHMADAQLKQVVESASTDLAKLYSEQTAKLDERLQKTLQDFIVKTNSRAQTS